LCYVPRRVAKPPYTPLGVGWRRLATAGHNSPPESNSNPPNVTAITLSPE
jgi:hypothetical protein